MSFRKSALLVIAAAVLLCAAAPPARAQGVTLRFHDGLVTLTAENAPLRAILAEWASLGGATIVNAERVVGPPLTLELNAVPERQAIDILLRNVSGYMAAQRAAGTTGGAVYDRILILPTSTAPRNPPPQPAFQGQRPGTRPPLIVPQPEPEEFQEEPAPDDDVQPVKPLLRPRAVPGRPQEFPTPDAEFEPENGEPAESEPDATEPTPANPFGIPAGATSRPGIITPVPEQEPPQRTQPDPEP